MRRDSDDSPQTWRLSPGHITGGGGEFHPPGDSFKKEIGTDWGQENLLFFFEKPGSLACYGVHGLRAMLRRSLAYIRRNPGKNSPPPWVCFLWDGRLWRNELFVGWGRNPLRNDDRQGKIEKGLRLSSLWADGRMLVKGFGSDLNPLTFLAKFIIIYLEMVFYRKNG